MKKTLRAAVVGLALVPMMALAGPADRGGPGGPELDASHMEKREKRMRTMFVLGLTEELELDTAQAVKMDETLKTFSERRRPLLMQVRESAQVLKRAAEGDAAALGQVDSAAQRAFDARAQMAALDRELYQTLSKDLTPQKRAKLALFMARAHHKMQKGMGGGAGEGGRRRMRMQPPQDE